MFEASDDLGGQWHTQGANTAASGPGMRTNTSRAMTAFSDYAPPATWSCIRTAEQVHEYLRSYAMAFGVDGTGSAADPGRVTGAGLAGERRAVRRGRARVRTIPGTAATVGPGQFQRAAAACVRLPGAEPFVTARVLVYGNGVSGHEIASDLASHAGGATPVISAYRKPRYVLQKNVAGVPSDWQWYTQIAALRRATMSPRSYARSCAPGSFASPVIQPISVRPLPTMTFSWPATRCARTISCRFAKARSCVARRLQPYMADEVEFADGTRAKADTIVCATGYRLDIPYLPRTMWSALGADLRLHHRTLHPDIPGLGVIGQFALQGPYLPLLELQARWIVGVWSGEIPPPDEPTMRASLTAAPPAMDSHNVLAMTLAEAAGVTPDLRARPDLAEPLLFGPMLPPRYRLDGPGASTDAAQQFRTQLASSPRPAVEPDDIDALADLGLPDLTPVIDKTDHT